MTMFKKVCKWCGKEFETTSTRRIYCGDDYINCVVCGKLVKIKEMSAPPKTCSMECRQAQIARVCLEKYGSTAAVTSDYAKEKAKQTCLEKYGVEHYTQTAEYRDKFKRTMQARYGADSPLQSATIREKVNKTNIERYGGLSPSCDAAVAQKARETAQRNYGGFGWASPVLKERINETMLQQYGVCNPMQSLEIRSKAQATCCTKYGAHNYNASDIAVSARITDPSKADNYVQFKQDGQKFISSYFSQAPTILELSRELGVDATTVSAQVQIQQLGKLIAFHCSDIERQVFAAIKSFNPLLNIQQFNRSVIPPQEIDIYLPELKIGIECNPTITHNSSFKDPWGADFKSYKYHQTKSLRCRDAGIFLFHIFGYEWTHKRDVIESMLRNLVAANLRKIYARNTYVAELTSEECKSFLAANHRQGATNASVRLGLKLKSTDELVSVMTFNKLRKTIGESNRTDTSSTVELSRFCNLLNTSVVGGASKLFKYYAQHTDVKKIISFSDVAHTRGNLYSTLGFVQTSESGPGYTWVSLADDSYINRVSCQKSNLRNLFHDNTIDVEHKTEREVMMEHGYAQVFDSGTIRWEYNL